MLKQVAVSVLRFYEMKTRPRDGLCILNDNNLKDATNPEDE